MFLPRTLNRVFPPLTGGREAGSGGTRTVRRSSFMWFHFQDIFLICVLLFIVHRTYLSCLFGAGVQTSVVMTQLFSPLISQPGLFGNSKAKL